MQHIAILVNPLAGKGKSKRLLNDVVLILQKKSISYSVFVMDWPKEFKVYSDIWIIGGDGTLNFFLNKYPDIHLPISIFPGGTGNDFYWKLYSDISINQQINLILSSSTKKIDAGFCNEKVFINGVGVGFDGAVLQSMRKGFLFSGHLAYLPVVIKKIFSFAEYSYDIEVNNEFIAQNKKFLLAMVTNSSRTGGGFLVSPDAKIYDGKLNLLLCTALPILNRLRYLPVIEKGNHLRLPFIMNSLAESVLIRCEKIIPAQIDGELFYSNKFEIKVLKGKYNFKY